MSADWAGPFSDEKFAEMIARHKAEADSVSAQPTRTIGELLDAMVKVHETLEYAAARAAVESRFASLTKLAAGWKEIAVSVGDATTELTERYAALEEAAHQVIADLDSVTASSVSWATEKKLRDAVAGLSSDKPPQ